MSDNEFEQDSGETPEQGQEEAATAQAEIERLQAEVAGLQQQVAESKAVREMPKHTGRRILVGLLILLGCFVAAGANTTLWLRNVVLDTDSWVSAVGPLSQNEVIVNTVSAYVVGEVFAMIDVEQVAQKVLPPEVSFLSAPLTHALRDVVRDLVADVLKSDEFNTVWTTANRAAHSVIVGALTSDGDLLYLQDGRLTIDLQAPFQFIQSTLGLGDVDLFADENWGTFVLFESYQVAALQQILKTLNAIGLLLPIVALLFFVVAWLASLWRRQTLLWIGVGVAVTMALSLTMLALSQPVVLASIANPIIRAVAGEIWDVVTRGLVYQTIFLGIVGVLVAVGAALAGPQPRAVAFRASVSGWFGGSKE